MSQPPATPSASAPKSVTPWILGPWQDLLLFVGTPVLIIPMIWTASQFWSIDEVSLFVLAFGSLGHHLPGMIRAYGDRELFAQYKVRFIVAPIVIIAFSLYSVFHQLQGLILIGVVWGVWHALMQTYGFVRIYDSKVKSVDTTTARIDLAMCIAWFGAAIGLSQDRSIMLLELFYAAGGPIVPGSLVIATRSLWAVATAAISVLFVANLVRNRLRARPISPVKIGLMISSFAFYWYANAVTSSLLLGLAMFEIFHDVQYLSIVWLFNRNRVRQNANVTNFVRFIFQNSGARIALYVGLVLLYGSLRFWEQGFLGPGRLRDSLTALLAASGILHFYYDGFIWKIRNAETQQGLGVGAANPTNAQAFAARWRRSLGFRHGLKWLWIAVPMVALTFAQFYRATPTIGRLQSIVELFPNNADLLCRLANESLELGSTEDAERYYRLALEQQPNHEDANLNLGVVYRRDNRTHDAVKRFQRVLQSAPNHAAANEYLGSAYADLGLLEEAESRLRVAIEQPESGFPARHNLSLVIARQGDLNESSRVLREAIEQSPNHPIGWYNYAKMLRSGGRLEDAERAYSRALELEPTNVAARNNLAEILVRLDRSEEAIAQLRLVLQQLPSHAGARQNMEQLIQHRTQWISVPKPRASNADQSPN